jgi:hypothetical protein
MYRASYRIFGVLIHNDGRLVRPLLQLLHTRPTASGFIDYRTAIGMALDAGFSAPFCVEHYGGDGLSVAASNREYIRRILSAKLGA